MSLAGKLQRFLDKHGVYYREGKRAFVTACLSPSCGKEDHCYIWKSDGGAICFRCGHKWRWKRMVAAIAGCSVQDAYEAFHGQGAGEEIAKPIDVDLLFHSEDQDEDEKPEPSITLGPDFVDAAFVTRALEYLVKRGVTEADLIGAYQLKYQAAMDAVVFPIMRDEKTYGWQARRIDPKEGELRLISQQSFSKAKFLLNYDRAKKFPSVVVVEGPFDCIHTEANDHGISGVASLGKNISHDQIKLILDLPSPRIYLGLDPDASEEVYEVVRRLGLGKTLYRIWPPKHRKDFGECTKDEVLAAVKAAVSVTSQSDLLDVYLK
jgi:Zn ribbon nucleic-acid-binding protein